MKKIWLSPYELQSRSLKRKGFLLKTRDSEGRVGYSDIFPWTEFGDPSFEEIPEAFKSKSLAPLLDRSLYLSTLDAKARSENRCLLESVKLSNHYLITQPSVKSINLLENALSDGFKQFKIKVGRSPQKELEFIEETIKSYRDHISFRLDFNCKATEDFCQKLLPHTSHIEFIEDPFVEANLWKNFDLPWAFDQPNFPISDVKVDWQIIKPAKQSNPDNHDKNYVFTSYMDHPIGVAHACHQASVFGKQERPYGLLTSQIYEPNQFNEYINIRKTEISFEPDVGIGFTEALEGQDWIEQ